MRKIYLVRHGETYFNRKMRHQHHAVPLSPLGEEQVKKTAQHFKHIPIDLLVSSDIVRARQTAEVIKTELEIDILFSDLFREVRRPSSIMGKSYFHPRAMWAISRIYMTAEHPTWHFEDEENIADIQARAHAALTFLRDRHEQNILVISHRVLITALLAAIEFPKRDTITQFAKGLRHAARVKNTSITRLESDKSTSLPVHEYWKIAEIDTIDHLLTNS